MTFGEGLPMAGQQIKIKWGEGDWIDFGTLRIINEVPHDVGQSWLLSSERYQNSVVRYYDFWEVKV